MPDLPYVTLTLSLSELQKLHKAATASSSPSVKNIPIRDLLEQEGIGFEKLDHELVQLTMSDSVFTRFENRLPETVANQGREQLGIPLPGILDDTPPSSPRGSSDDESSPRTPGRR